MHPLRTLLAAIILGPYAAFVANAIGDSGGCMDFKASPLGQALREGTPQNVEREILAWVEKFAPRSIWPGAREREILNLIQGTHGKGAVCAPGELLPIALNAGNVEVTKFLLTKPLGVEPKVSTTILFNTCEYRGSMSEQQRNARRQALEVLLDRKLVDVNALLDERYPILLLCKQPELVALYLEKGARVDMEVADGLNLLEAAILDAMLYEEGSKTARALHAVERAKLFSHVVTNSIVGRPIERRLLSCKQGTAQRKQKTCRELATFIKASPGVFGEP